MTVTDITNQLPDGTYPLDYPVIVSISKEVYNSLKDYTVHKRILEPNRMYIGVQFHVILGTRFYKLLDIQELIDADVLIRWELSAN